MKKKYKILTFTFLCLIFFAIATAAYLFIKSEIVYGILCLVPLNIFLIMTYVFFAKHTNQYPLNTYKDFLYDSKISQLGHVEDGRYEIELREKEKGIWEIKTVEEHLIFDMNGYFFPKTYICTFFIRNLHYYVINKNKYKLNRLFMSLSLEPLKKFQNFSIVFCNKKRRKKLIIVKNGRTKVGVFRGMVIQTKYYIDTITSGHGNLRMRKHEELSEENYNNETKNQQKYSLK